MIATALLSLAPQIHFWFARGADWHGAYATLQGDEFLYSAYINALIDSRPRRNDPFTGRDSVPASPLPESTFSIQFIPSYVIAGLAKLCGASASGAFLALIAISGLLASLSLYWLLFSITSDGRLAAAGVILVVCCGAFAGGQGILGLLTKPGVVFLGLPFLRRYQPALVFPLFFVFCVLIWKALHTGNRPRLWLYSTLAGFTLALLIFSYLYLWTTAAAWLACLAILWLYLRPKGEKGNALVVFSITSAIAVLALIPYAYLVSHRATSLDDAQTLILTHRPDLFRVPEIIGTIILFVLFTCVRRGKVERSDSRLVFAASFALLPLTLFNQQLVTGRSMQPFHFEAFIANYAVLVSFVLAARLFWQTIPSRVLVWIALLCFLWGEVEVTMPVLANYEANVAADQMVPVLLRLRDLSKQDGTLTSLREQGHSSTLVFSPERDVMGMLPTWTPQGTLLGMGGLDFGSAAAEERKEMLYMYFYYSAVKAERLREVLNEGAGDTFMSHYARIAIFGHERVVPMLSAHFKPISHEEVEDEVRRYQAYINSFSREKVLRRPIAYVITRGESDLSNVDLWYERDAGERIGGYSLYRLNLR